MMMDHSDGFVLTWSVTTTNDSTQHIMSDKAFLERAMPL